VDAEREINISHITVNQKRAKPCQILCAVTRKKGKQNMRDWKTTCCEIIVPVFFITFGVWYSTFDMVLQSESKVLSID